MTAASPPPTLGDLLAERSLALRPLTRLSRDQLDSSPRGAHSSDLADPTPFLDENVILLTTGAQFDGVDAKAYVERVASRGIAALGFGSGVVRPAAPAGLVAACDRAGLALFEVPYETPFLAVVRTVADRLAAHAFSRRDWAVSAQQSISRAALRDAPLASAIGELARQLDTWVGLFDPLGELTVSHPEAVSPAPARVQARRMLERGRAAADTVSVGDRVITLQTLGRAGELRGLLAYEGSALDQEARGVVTTVVAMAGFALERASDLARAHGTLRAGVLRALLGGEIPLARDVAVAAWGGLPAEPVRVTAVRRPGDDLHAYLETRAAHAPHAIFFAPSDHDLVVVAPADQDPLDEVWSRFGVGAGRSRSADYAGLGRALDEARAAVPRSGTATFSPGSTDLFHAPSEDQRAAARALLRPIRQRDEQDGSALEDTVRVWLAHDANNDRAAAALGIHRHTMRARLRQASSALDLDLASFGARAVLWTALRVENADQG